MKKVVLCNTESRPGFYIPNEKWKDLAGIQHKENTSGLVAAQPYAFLDIAFEGSPQENGCIAVLLQAVRALLCTRLLLRSGSP